MSQLITNPFDRLSKTRTTPDQRGHVRLLPRAEAGSWRYGLLVAVVLGLLGLTEPVMAQTDSATTARPARISSGTRRPRITSLTATPNPPARLTTAPRAIAKPTRTDNPTDTSTSVSPKPASQTATRAVANPKKAAPEPPKAVPSSQDDAFVAVLGYAGSGGVLPFYFNNYQYGIQPNAPNAIGLRAGLNRAFIPLGKNQKWFLGYGAEVAVFGSAKPNVLLPVAYASLRYGAFELTAGRQKEVFGLVGDSTLSMGPMIWSGTALPMPKIKIQTTHYVPLLFRGGLSFQGYFAHGWFDNQGPVKGSYLHQKYLYFRIGRDESRVKLYGGINHQAQWGGQNPNWSPAQAVNGVLPADLGTYLSVVVPAKAFVGQDTTVSAYADRGNRPGDHRGTIDIGAEVQLGDYNLFGYKQTIYETGRTFSSLVNADDGLYGLRLKTPHPWLETVVVEFMKTLNQGAYRSAPAKLLGLPDRHAGELENYFNSDQYQSWAYRGQSLGTPFLTVAEGYPAKTYGSINNRILAYQLAFSGTINGFRYKTKLAYSQNYGNYGVPFVMPKDQFSALLDVQKTIPWLNKTVLNVAFAYDAGTLLPNTANVRFGLRKNW